MESNITLADFLQADTRDYFYYQVVFIFIYQYTHIPIYANSNMQMHQHRKYIGIKTLSCEGKPDNATMQRSSSLDELSHDKHHLGEATGKVIPWDIWDIWDWFVLIKMLFNIVDRFRSLLDSDGDPIVDNFRPIQVHANIHCYFFQSQHSTYPSMQLKKIYFHCHLFQHPTYPSMQIANILLKFRYHFLLHVTYFNNFNVWFIQVSTHCHVLENISFRLHRLWIVLIVSPSLNFPYFFTA